MDIHTAPTRNNQLDYLDEMDPKNAKHVDDRVDSGMDSLKEDEYQILVQELMCLSCKDAHRDTMDNAHTHQAWKCEVTEDGDTYLHLAIIHEAEHEALEIIKHCVNDPFLNSQNHQRQTALHLAVIMEQPHIVEELLKAGCDPRLVDQCGNTALHIACRKGSLSCFAVLTQVNTHHLRSILSVHNYSGHTCLHIASIYGFLSLVENIVQLGADINAKEQCSGRTCLHLAVDLQNLALVQQLIALGADVNSMTYGGHVPYHLTFGRQNGEIQKQLFVRTASPLRQFPDSESESEEELMSDDECGYDDIQFGGK
ncbi:nuclear factor of kappa light polypeptide gene enhancer in B-cells inhibitor, alpha a [Tachysurus fulvidraco]|uniref:nuclear factor of kappa light polypeptide gene enhancer in B-cells inhibitor, alpha a n=1 Tax=Tachysurus fulvidraco TaxID=1234273 RepID=UPI000F4ED2B0|nr:nuclear factor of kappa light polypeptide gene enhancer in B-cells inhibitor, alpha a [Tachysurus fulvidraco]